MNNGDNINVSNIVEMWNKSIFRCLKIEKSKIIEVIPNKIGSKIDNSIGFIAKINRKGRA